MNNYFLYSGALLAGIGVFFLVNGDNFLGLFFLSYVFITRILIFKASK